MTVESSAVKVEIDDGGGMNVCNSGTRKSSS